MLLTYQVEIFLKSDKKVRQFIYVEANNSETARAKIKARYASNRKLGIGRVIEPEYDDGRFDLSEI